MKFAQLLHLPQTGAGCRLGREPHSLRSTLRPKAHRGAKEPAGRSTGEGVAIDRGETWQSAAHVTVICDVIVDKRPQMEHLHRRRSGVDALIARSSQTASGERRGRMHNAPSRPFARITDGIRPQGLQSIGPNARIRADELQRLLHAHATALHTVERRVTR
jgi:hypothetical protein